MKRLFLSLLFLGIATVASAEEEWGVYNLENVYMCDTLDDALKSLETGERQQTCGYLRIETQATLYWLQYVSYEDTTMNVFRALFHLPQSFPQTQYVVIHESGAARMLNPESDV